MRTKRAAAFHALLLLASWAVIPAPPAAADDVVLKSGETISGIAEEDGLLVSIRSGNGIVRVDARSVERIDWKRPSPWLAPQPAWPDDAGAVPDLDVTHIEILPRIPRPPAKDLWRQCAEKPGPPEQRLVRRPGDTVTIVAHLANRGAADAACVRYSLRIDGQAADSGVIRMVGAGKRTAVSVRRTYEASMQEASFEVDSGEGNRNRETCFSNNRLSARFDAVTVLAAAGEAVFRSFCMARNMTGSFSFEDYVQRHAALANAILASSPGPGAARAAGIRIDGIAVCGREEAMRIHRGPAGGNPLYGAVVFVEEPVEPGGTGALPARWPLVRDMLASLGISDLSMYLDPEFPAGSREGLSGIMASPGPAPLSELDALALARFGPGAAADSLLCIPESVLLRIENAAGTPAKSASISARDMDGDSRETPLQGAGSGLFALPPQGPPWLCGASGAYAGLHPFGRIAMEGGVMEVHATFEDGSTGVAALEIPVLNLAFLRGSEKEATIILQTAMK